MPDAVDRARARRNLIERIGAHIPGIEGYLEREMRREVDKMERDWLAARLDRVREALQAKVRELSRSGNLAGLDRAASAEKALDRLANRVRHADYGYTGYFDAVKIYEEELDRLYEFDLALIESVEALARQVEELPDTAATGALGSLVDAIGAVDRHWDERASVYEDVTQKGAR